MHTEMMDVVRELLNRLEEKALTIGKLEHDIALRDKAIEQYQAAAIKQFAENNPELIK